MNFARTHKSVAMKQRAKGAELRQGRIHLGASWRPWRFVFCICWRSVSPAMAQVVSAPNQNQDPRHHHQS